jgi:hypothetical protein
MLILAVALCLASGYLLIGALWPQHHQSFSDFLLTLPLAAGFGLGVYSVTLFVLRLLDATHLFAVDASLLVLLLILYLLRRRRPPGVYFLPRRYQDFELPDWVRGVLAASFAIAAVAALWNAVLRIVAYPHGDGWDAFSIWNLHARFLFLDRDHWRDGFNALIPWSHPDYPLLLPAAIAHFWSYLGHDSPMIPAIIGLVFTFSTVVVLVSSLRQLRGPMAAMLAGLALLTTPLFVEQGTSQYADVPLSFFILASTVLVYFGCRQRPSENPSGPFVLAGLAAGLAAWTKNEGLLFLFASVMAQFFCFGRQDAPSHGSGVNRRCLALFAFGAAPVLTVVAWFKHAIATPGDLFSSPAIMIEKVFTPRRSWVILQWFAKEFLRFGHWWIIPGTMALVAFYLLTLHERKDGRDPLLQASALALGLTLAGYFAIYLITPRDLYWHLRFSLNRLFLQLWPSAVFLFFLFVGGQISQNRSNFTPKPTVC